MLRNILVILAIMLTAAPALADPEALFRQGQEFYAAGNYPAAYEAYRQAFAEKEAYDIAGNLGNVEVKLGKFRDACIHLQYVLDNIPPSLDINTREAVTAKTLERLAECKQHVAMVTLAVTPDGATVAVDGVNVGLTPLARPIVLDPGNHQIVASKDGYQRVEQTYVAQANTSQTVNISMVEGDSGPTPVRGGGGDVSTTMIAVAITGGVLALGALGAGIALHVVAAGKGDDREALAGELGSTSACTGSTDPRCSEIEDLANDERTMSGAGTAMLIVGGALAVATVLTVVLWPSSGTEERAQLWAAPTPGGAVIGGSF